MAGRLSLRRWFSAKERKNELDTSAFIKLLQTLGLKSKSGVDVTIDRALGTTTVLAATRALAEGISQMPAKIMNGDDTKKEVARDHPVHRVLAIKPNQWMGPFSLRETLMYHAVLTGNAFAVKVVLSTGELKELLPVPPGAVTIRRNNFRLTYDVNDAKGLVGTFDQSQMFHLRGPSWDAYCGMEVVRLARESIGLAIATEANHAYLHANGSKVDGILTTEKSLETADIERIRALWDAAREVKFGTALLDNGLKYEKMGMSGVDTQHIQTREFQIQEICRAIGVFPMIVGFADKTATFASAEAFFTAHVKLHLMPWVRRWEDAVNTQLLSDKDIKNQFFCKLFPDSLLRGDVNTRKAFYQVMVLTGIMTRNEVRALEDLNPLDGLDEPLVPLNMGVVGESNDAGAGPGGTQNVPGGLVVPKSVADRLYGKLIGHNGGPPLDDEPQNVGRALSAKNERKIRDASASIASADVNLQEVLSDLDKEKE